MKKVLITGASGFIGSYLKEHLTGYEISILSLRDPNWRQQPIDADVVIHCAGLAHSKKSLPKERYMDVNCHVTKELLELSIQHKVSHFIFLSTMLVYGEGNIGAIGLNSKINPMSDYAESKVCAEEVISKNKNIKSTILRIPLVMGNNTKGNLRTIGLYAKYMPLFFGIDNRRSVLYLSDLLSLLDTLIINGTEGILNPHSNILSTTDMFKLARRDKFKTIFPFPLFLKRILASRWTITSKIFGDAYYLEGVIKHEDSAD